MKQSIIPTNHLELTLAEVIAECERDRIFVLTDDNTVRKCWPKISSFLCLKRVQLITIDSDDKNKNLASLEYVWNAFQSGGATRHSLLINLGGGMVTDLGGFAAATFKRGINFINIPTTLLAMVDAAAGGKTGINFGGLKNEIGLFAQPNFVIIDAEWLESLDHANILSGYAEMLKHGLLSSRNMWAELIDIPTLAEIQPLIGPSIEVKERIVEADPNEHGLRKALNFGHTFGHAFEEWAMKRSPILHGYAVAFGLIAELYLSTILTGFPSADMYKTVQFIRENYGSLPITCNDYPELIDLMRHDKKNRGSQINCTLLEQIGTPHLDYSLNENYIKEALDFSRFT